MIAAALLLLLAALLAIPFGLRFELSGAPRPQGRAQLLWAFGLVRVNLTAPSSGPSTPKAKRADKKARRKKRRSGRRGNATALLRDADFRARCLRFVGDLWRAIGKRGLRLRLLIGLDDPAETGRLWAFVGPAAALAGQLDEVTVDIAPDFNEARLEYDGSGTIRIIPLQILGLIVGMALSPTIWRGLIRMRATGG